MKKVYLKWFLPTIVMYLVVGITCFAFRGIVRREIILNELNKIAHGAEESLRSVDGIIQTVVDYNNSTAVSFANMDFYEDQDKIVNVLKVLSQNESVLGSLVCNLEGQGVNEKGVQIDISKEAFFADVVNNYSNGGIGMVAVTQDGYFEVGSVVAVNFVNFNGTTKGFLLTGSKVTEINDRIFSHLPPLDLAVLVDISGHVYAGEFDGENLWKDSIDVLPDDTIKLNISQKKYYTSRIEGYGDLVVIPAQQTAGGIVLLASDANMKPLIRPYMMNFYWLLVVMLAIVSLYILVNLLIFVFGNLIRKAKAAKESEKIKTDLITGLYNELGFTSELNGYTRYAGDRNGILFAISIDSDNSTEKMKIIEDVATELKNTYRITDILGRGDDGAFLIFLKGFEGEKDIRKQTDELQLFLYDLKSGLLEDGQNVNISAGRAIYPKNGGNVEELLSAVRGALEKSKAEGRGSISFCE